MKKMFAALLVGAMSLSMLAGCGSKPAPAPAPAATEKATEAAETEAADSDWAYLQEKGKVTVGMTLFAPMSYYDADNNFIGFDTELTEAAFEKLGIDVEFVEINWDSKEVELSSKNIDCIWNGLCITEERKQNMSITEPYLLNTFAVVTKADRLADILAGGMEGLTVTSEQGSTCEGVALGTIEGDAEAEVSGAEFFAGSNYVAVDSQAKSLMEVKAGTADVSVIDTVAAAAMTGPGTDYEDLAFDATIPFVTQYFGIAFRQGSDVTAMMDAAIAELYADGTVAEIAEKYNLTDLLLQ